jgi:uncharacterized protein YndB with AHSA1/START domain
MANPLQILPLKTLAIQFIEETTIAAPNQKVWSTVINPTAWFQFDADPAKHGKHSFELRPGGQWTATNPSGSANLLGTVVYYEPGKLLRIQGQVGLSHLPVNGVVIFELQEKDGGTLLRVGMRLIGFMDEGVEARYQGAWKHLLSQIKAASEK